MYADLNAFLPIALAPSKREAYVHAFMFRDADTSFLANEIHRVAMVIPDSSRDEDVHYRLALIEAYTKILSDRRDRNFPEGG